MAKDPGGPTRLIDDHLHDPPGVVYELLEALAEHVPHSLTVIVERDGHFPNFGLLLDQVSRARSALIAGRRRRQRRGAVEAA